MNRISQKFKYLKRENKKALIVYIMAGDPSLSATERLVPAIEKSGADLIELGVPFSDPIADGAIIQAAGKRALEKGATLQKVFSLVGRLRGKTKVPLVLMLYYNLILHFGEEKFILACRRFGVDGLIVPDLPVEEAINLRRLSKDKGIATIFFVTPTSNRKRMMRACLASSGFVYYISRTGVTGAKTSVSQELKKQIKMIKRVSKKPICVGFGIRDKKQVAMINKFADGCIIGSAIVEEISRYALSPQLVGKVSQFIRRLRV